MDNDNEEFGVNEDDLARAYNPYAFRRKQTKDQAALGIWADSDSDDERVGLGAKNSRGGRRGVDLSAPVQFISAGFTQPGSKEAAQKKKRAEAEQSEAAEEEASGSEEEAADDDDDDDDQPAPFDFTRPPRRGVFDSTEEAETEGEPLTSQPNRRAPSAAGRNTVAAAATASSTIGYGVSLPASTMHGGRGGARFGGRGAAAGAAASSHAAHTALRGFGSWERHTKGIGRKLLEKMGFEYGKGLGSKQQGIALPVQAFQRRGKGALGFHGSERADQTLFVPDADTSGPQASSSASTAQRPAKPAVKAYKKGPQRREHEEVYLTADELIKMNPSRGGLGMPIVTAEPSAGVAGGGGVGGSGLSSVKVIDLRGPEQRVYSGYSAMAAKISSDTPAVGRSHRGAVGEEDEEAGAETARKRNFGVPKLEHNLNLLVELSEQEILHNHKMLREHQLRLESLHSEQDQLITRCDEDKKLLPRLDALDLLVSEIEKMAVENEESSVAAVPDAQRQLAACRSSLERCVAIVRRLRSEFAAECSLLELDQLAPLLLAPLVCSLSVQLVKKLLAKWKPLIEPSFGIAEMRRIRRALESDSTHSTSEEAHSQAQQRDEQLFTQLLSTAWLPTIEGVVQRWNTRNPDPLINLLETWCSRGSGSGTAAGASAASAIDVDGMEEEVEDEPTTADREPLVPAGLRTYVLEQCVLRRLHGEVLAWDPLVDTVPIHCWIHPWLPLLKDQLGVLYPTIRAKIGMALDGQAGARGWHPSDPSARGLLEPWTSVWPRGETQAFLARHIMPKLLACMQHELVIDPSRPTNDPSQAPQLEHLFSWIGLLPTANILHIVEQAFFPKWLGVLRIWLDSPSVDLDEVARWYLTWKQCFPADLLQIQSVQDYLGQALNLMNAASNKSAGGPRVVAPPPPPPPPESSSAVESGFARVRGVESSATAAANVRELVERRAAQLGIEFTPLVAAGGSLGTHPLATGVAAGKQLYRLGSVAIFIDRNVVFARLPGAGGSTNAQWTPLTITSLFELASKKSNS